MTREIPTALQWRRLTVALCGLLAWGCGGQHVYRRATVREAHEDGLAFLLSRQNRSGSFGSARQSHGFDVPVVAPHSYWAEEVSCTALAVMALRGPSKRDPAAARARDRAIAYLTSERGKVYRAAPGELYNVWTHCYVVQALSEVLRDEASRPGVRAAVEWNLKMLATYETMWGGWQYYDTFGAVAVALEPTSFTTATALVALDEARAAGVTIPERLIRRAIKVIVECRNPDGTYNYDWGRVPDPSHLINKAKGNISRAQPCNLALWLWGPSFAVANDAGNPGKASEGRGPVTREKVIADLDLMFREHKWLDIGRKRPIPHEAWYYHAGYFYYYAHYYAMRLILRLGEGGARFRGPLVDSILPHQEADGSWWDFPEFSYDKVYGTALALLTIEPFID